MRSFAQAALLLLAGSALDTQGVSALSAAEWRKQSIYQVVTDRFARTDLSTTASCNTADQVYCGGTWRGLISKLDYIKGMGFTAVWISPIVKQIDGYSQDGLGSACHVRQPEALANKRITGLRTTDTGHGISGQ